MPQPEDEEEEEWREPLLWLANQEEEGLGADLPRDEEGAQQEAQQVEARQRSMKLAAQRWVEDGQGKEEWLAAQLQCEQQLCVMGGHQKEKVD